MFVLCACQRSYQDCGHLDGSARLLALRALHLVAVCPLIPRPYDRECATHQVDVIPRQREDLAAAHAGRDRQQHGQVEPSSFHCAQQRSDLVFAEHLDSMAFGPRQFNASLGVSRVECDPVQLDGL
ncbi:MAG: hypothetical protein CVT59_04055 [Actinobacteria bacterium HGW-Actinobacteria-1]|nr:MAG: hypothetical protein CVT59_04055 [Actinobacteria bacterium HGW-Actinobacteria-1]